MPLIYLGNVQIVKDHKEDSSYYELLPAHIQGNGAKGSKALSLCHIT